MNPRTPSHTSLFLSITFLLIFTHDGFAQRIRKGDRQVINNIQQHVSFLADDKLEGRRAGTKGEQLAVDYVSTQFKNIGLIPKGENGSYLQSFPISDGKSYDKSFLVLNGDQIRSSDFFPFPASPSKTIEELPSIALRESGVPWFLNLADDLQANAKNPHFDIAAMLIAKINSAAKKGASAFIIYNLSGIDDGLAFDPKEKGEALPIPTLYVKQNVAKKYFNDETAAIDIKIKVDFTERSRTGHNVIGYIDNGSTNTVVLGAHVDHLGYGEDGGSLYRGGDKQIHNGADDNASGTAALIELARMFKADKRQHNNYLFVAFSGEELGLFGSKFLTDHSPITMANIDYMVNMDMVGRLSDSSKSLTIGGYGTSPAFATAIHNTPESRYFNIKFDSSGSGPSDHTSFYRKDVPVLFLFTGLHQDYHRPTDDADKLNYEGEFRIVRFVHELVEHLDNSNKIAFQKTRDQQMGGAARFSVTMGIMPDYTFSGAGIRVDGVSDGRPAQKAGLLAGDVVIKLGDYPVSSMDNYMQALGKFKKGDKTVVQVKRGNDQKSFDIQF